MNILFSLQKGYLQNRVYFGVFDTSNDRGVRAYSWLTSLFLRCVGKKITILNVQGHHVYLDKNSLDKWLNTHEKDVQEGSLNLRINRISLTHLQIKNENFGPNDNKFLSEFFEDLANLIHRNCENFKASLSFDNDFRELWMYRNLIILPSNFVKDKVNQLNPDYRNQKLIPLLARMEEIKDTLLTAFHDRIQGLPQQTRSQYDLSIREFEKDLKKSQPRC